MFPELHLISVYDFHTRPCFKMANTLDLNLQHAYGHSKIVDHHWKFQLKRTCYANLQLEKTGTWPSFHLLLDTMFSVHETSKCDSFQTIHTGYFKDETKVSLIIKLSKADGVLRNYHQDMIEFSTQILF